jgi:hypothetical protein
MRQFKWIEWNLQKLDAHGLSADEVEAAFDRIIRLEERSRWVFSDVGPSARWPPDLGDLAI